MEWLKPNPMMRMAPAPSGNGMLKIIEDGGRFKLYRQTSSGMDELGDYGSLVEADAEARKS